MNVLKFMQPKIIMLEVGENLVVLNMVQNMPADTVFKKFTGNTSQGNWSVVFSQASVAFLENWCNVSQRPVINVGLFLLIKF